MYFFQSIYDGESFKIAVDLFFLFTFWLFLSPALGRSQMSSGEERCVSSFEVDFDGPGELIDVSVSSLLLLEAATVTWGLDLSVTWPP